MEIAENHGYRFLQLTFSLFERGAAAVGYDFMSHPFWDKYLEFEESRQNVHGQIALLERIIRLPLHQYARYFEKYTQITSKAPLEEWLTPDELLSLQTKVQSDMPEKIGQDFDDEVKSQALALKTAIYTANQEAVTKRWVFESGIKRSYFHIKPLDEVQKTNWKKYLDFEEEEGDIARIYALYERCVVPCVGFDISFKIGTL